MLVRGTFVHCLHSSTLEILHDYLLAVDDLGCITHFNAAASSQSTQFLTNIDELPKQLPEGSFLLPTFCDLHLHAPQFLYQGNGLHLPLMEWLDEYAFKAEERLDADPKLARRVYTRLAERLVENGTGAVLLFGTIKEETNLILADVMHKAGIRAFVGKLSMDQSSRPSYVEESADNSLDAARSFVGKMKSVYDIPHLVEPVITPRFVPTCSDTLLKGLGDLAASQDLRIQSHLAESHDQVEAVRSERGEEDLLVFRRSNLLTPRTIQAHCTFLDVPSLSQLRECGTAVAHCPLSNAYFSAKPFCLREALDQGLKVGLGTDVAGGYSLDIMNAMRQAVVTSRMRQGSNIMNCNSESTLAINWIEALFLATRGGAISLGLPFGCGLFQVGAPFDVQQISLWDTSTRIGVGALDFFDDAMKITPEVVEKWWCLGDNRNRASTWVQGIKL
ncbi:Metallo-dependent hydrolase [Guyanagaster necrorhizus]|uniref:Metallo-dependent hydrolase n=1 Tax=Guyanagaster necrorhizus TaxID=856835 RepID=A0A9P8AMK0_9AGAR|nr:Metallo-dependent hydrolase [Guyanagaster necrorhizus MCA 3950]KAG7440824.1 Metallo-dependent hydrolase [Guyanagaster necrorhizus MCA 3950]